MKTSWDLSHDQWHVHEVFIIAERQVVIEQNDDGNRTWDEYDFADLRSGRKTITSLNAEQQLELQASIAAIMAQR